MFITQAQKLKPQTNILGLFQTFSDKELAHLFFILLVYDALLNKARSMTCQSRKFF